MAASRDELAALYRRLCGEPRDKQLDVGEALLQGRSVVLRAPTGWGKSEAVFLPFLLGRGAALPSRLIYALPARALVDSLAARFQRHAARSGEAGLEVRAQHGARPESLLFWAPVVVTTLDQVVGAYACAPLSLSPRHGNIPAGAVASSLLVFDEVHTYDAERGLQCCLFLAGRAREVGVPFVLMTATLPGDIVEKIAARFDAAVVDVPTVHQPPRGAREVVLEYRAGGLLDARLVLREQERRGSRAIVVCNTVDRARGLAEDLRTQGARCLLVHSRFTDEDRRRKELALEEWFGRQATESRAVAVCTQVVEVGLDISADLMISELAPVDSLIQRVGRCARWGGSGSFLVYPAPSEPPYEEDIMQSTEAALQDKAGGAGSGGVVLDWPLERELVDKVLAARYEGMIEVQAAARAVRNILDAAWEGKPSKASAAVREADACEAVVAERPLPEGPQLPRVKVGVGTLRHFVGGLAGDGRTVGDLVWRLKWEQDGDEGAWAREEVCSAADIHVGGLYALSNAVCSYSPGLGLLLNQPGDPMTPQGSPAESWERHVLNVLRAYEVIVKPRERGALVTLARAVGFEADQGGLAEAECLVKMALVLHDLGKLSRAWQAEAQRIMGSTGPGGWTDEGLAGGASASLVAHTGKTGAKGHLPAHATVTGVALYDWLIEQWPRNNAGLAVATALAHHHGCRSRQAPKFELAAGWQEAVARVWKRAGLADIEVPWTLVKSAGAASCDLPTQVSPASPKPWTAYVILSRLLRLSDWASMGGEPSIMSMEDKTS